MYYRITDHVALRSWSDIGFAIYKRGIRKPFPLARRLASAMLLADGEHALGSGLYCDDRRLAKHDAAVLGEHR